MILGIRAAQTPHFQGFNVVLVKDWILPMDHVGSGCFKAFDEALGKLKTDIDATRVMAESPQLTSLSTASETALRSVSDRYRPSTRLYTVAVTPNADLSGRLLTWNSPAWIRVQIEDKDGALYSVRSPQDAHGWHSLPLRESDLFVHVCFFSEHGRLRLSQPSEARFFRLSQILEESQELSTARRWQMNIFPQDAL